jgi:glycosyltransferase involved in cell wall biosynthesis
MRILITSSIFPPEIGGPATYVYEFSKLAMGLGHKIRVVTLADTKPMTLKGAEVFQVKRSRQRFLRELALFSRILRAGRGFDVIYAQNPAAIGFPSVLAGKLLRKPVVVKYVGDTAWEKAFREGKTRRLLEDFLKRPDANASIIRIQRYTLRNATGIITPSGYLKRVLTRFYKIPEEKISVVPNAVSVAGIRIRKSKNPTLITVARIVPWKGIQDVVDLMPDLLVKRPDIEYLIVGAGPYEADLRRKVREMKLSGSVRFLGPLPHKETMEKIASSHVFVLNSLYEGMPHVLLEAMALGTPIVATDVCGNPELIEDDKEGCLVRPGDKKAIKSAIEKLLTDEKLSASFARASKEKASKYNWGALIRNTLRALET